VKGIEPSFEIIPCGLLNVDSYPDHATAEGFLRTENRQMMLCDDTAVGLMQQFEADSAPKVEKWTA
jgi:hypothetical protein